MLYCRCFRVFSQVEDWIRRWSACVKTLQVGDLVETLDHDAQRVL